MEIYINGGQADSLRCFIEYYFEQSIKDDEEEVSLLYMYNILKIYEKLGGFEQYADYEPDNR